MKDVQFGNDFISLLHLDPEIDIKLEYYELLNDIAIFFVEAGRYKEAEFYYTKALKVAERFLEYGNRDVVGLYMRLADLSYEQENYTEAETNLRQALLLALQGEADQPLVAHVYRGLGKLYFAQNYFEKAALMYNRALSLYEKLTEDGYFSEDMINVLYSLAASNIMLEKYRDAVTHLDKAAAITQDVEGEQILERARDLYLIGLGYHRISKLYSDSLMSPSVAESDDVESKVLPYGRNKSSELSAHFKEAGELYIKAFKMLKALGENEHPLEAEILDDLEKLRQDWTGYNENLRQKQ